ncbi:MAG: hypothetical protein ACM3ML_00320 [Micromonosporaceae bacterium]
MSTRRRLAGHLAMLGITLGTSAWPGRTYAQCDTTAARGAWLVHRLGYWMTVSDTAKIRLREQAFRIPVVPPDSIWVVHDSSLCQAAAVVYARQFGAPPLPVAVVELRGTSDRWYAVYGAHVRAGEFGTVLIFDQTWRRVGGWTF